MDGLMRASVPGVYAAGDACSVLLPVMPSSGPVVRCLGGHVFSLLAGLCTCVLACFVRV